MRQDTAYLPPDESEHRYTEAEEILERFGLQNGGLVRTGEGTIYDLVIEGVKAHLKPTGEGIIFHNLDVTEIAAKLTRKRKP